MFVSIGNNCTTCAQAAKAPPNNVSSSWSVDDSCTCSCIGQIVPGHSKVFIISKTSTKSSANSRHDKLFA